MKARIIAVAMLVAALAVAAASSTAGGATKHSQASITVWLQVDAQSGWPELVADATAAFQKEHPGVAVNVQYQTWGQHLGKFDAALAGGNTPDVIELGNTEMTKYMAAGAFQDLSSLKSSFDNSSTWLAGLAASGRYNAKLYGVPYYAGSRVVTYRTDLFKQAGIKSAPTSLAAFTTDAQKLLAKNKQKGFSPVYIAGEDWYVALSFVYDYGGKIATQVSGKWKGLLDSPQAIAGLTAYKSFFNAASRASKTTDEARPAPYSVYAEGLAASMIGQGWFSCCVGKFSKVTSQFVMPSHVAGQPMPGFIGGSDLAVPVGGNKQLGADWIAAFTSTANEKALEAKGNIPNASNLLNVSKVNERAVLKSWFVPTAKNWVNVENGNILRTMLGAILTGRLSVKQAATTASDNISFTLNQP
jgi:N,N'-diacetylchitobiose transport system substrate-binding protein